MGSEVERAVRGAARDTAPPLSFGSVFVKSEAFRALFRDGMALVEATAGYLDGDGREASNALPRGAALTYASESMRLTTRLMQVASWLLVQRALAEGEITSTQAQREKERVKLSTQEAGASEAQLAALPDALRDLIAQSVRLHARIVHLDGLMAGPAAPERSSRPSPVFQQQRLLRSIFEVD